MSTLRCKPGDLCIILPNGESDDPDAGKFVTVMSRASAEEIRFALGTTFGDMCDGPSWRVDRDVTWYLHNAYTGTKTFQIPYCPDDLLLPIPPESDQVDVTRESEVTA